MRLPSLQRIRQEDLLWRIWVSNVIYGWLELAVAGLGDGSSNVSQAEMEFTDCGCVRRWSGA